VLGDGHAESVALFGVFDAVFQAGADATGRSGGDGVAPVIQAAHGDVEALALLAQPVLEGHLDILHDDAAGRAGAHAQLVLLVVGADAFHVPGDDEGGDPLVARLSVRVGLGEDDEVIGQRRQADPHLLAVEDVDIPFAAGGAAQVDRIAARLGLGQPVAGVLLAARLRDEEALFLLLGGPLQQGQAVEAGVHRHDHAQAGVNALQFLADQGQGDVVEALPTVADGDVDAQHTVFGQQRQHVGVRLVLAVPFLEGGVDFVASQLAHHVAGHDLFFVQGKIHSGNILQKAHAWRLPAFSQGESVAPARPVTGDAIIAWGRAANE